MTERITRDKVWNLFVLLKYLFSVYITAAAFQTNHNVRYLIFSMTELTVILAGSCLILTANKWIGHTVHFLLLLIYNIQTVVMYFSGSFVSLIMLTNLVFVKDLQGKFLLYLKMILPVIIFTCIPARRMELKRPVIIGLTTVCTIGLMGIGISGTSYSPIVQAYRLYQDNRSYQEMIREVQAVKSSRTAGMEQSSQEKQEAPGVDVSVSQAMKVPEFFAPEISDYISKPTSLPDHPNIILIFAEGLSENIIHDHRNIMPHIRNFEMRSLSFTDYYNHTFATLRGLIGQLYSGYQLENFDCNSLVSIQSILRDNGYRTAFINTEPENREFTDYLENLGFDEVLTDMELVNDNGSYIHDRDAFQHLFDSSAARHSAEKPFFTAMYTFGTHMSLTTADEKFEDGQDALLNRFYDLDCQFQTFLDQFENSALAEDTVLIFTADHATYADDDFLSAFPEYKRVNPCLDKIPLCIYHSGVEAGTAAVNGRNSLDLAPTVLDYLDITAPNYFLGQSLFAPVENADTLETTFHESASVLSSKNSEIRPLSAEAYTEFRDILIRYSSAKGVADIVPISEDQILVSISEDGAHMDVVLKTAESYENVWFPVWSDVDWQDDLIWHQADRNEDGSWSCRIDFSEHKGKGIFYVHAYHGSESPDDLAAVSWIYY